MKMFLFNQAPRHEDVSCA